MKPKIFCTITIVLTFLISSTYAIAAEYQHSIDLKKLQFNWTVSGSSLKIQLIGNTKGWVAVGFNATEQMKNANIIIGYVKKGKVKISDDFGIKPTKHKSDKKLKGKKNLKGVSGSEKKGVTTLSFSIPLNSGDKYDGVIKPNGDTRVIVATGKRDSFRLGHNFQATLDVNLSTGQYKMK